MLAALIAAVSIGLAQPGAAMTAAPSVDSLSCRADLDSLDSRIRLDYAGFLLEVTGANLTRYEARLAELRRAAGRASGDACLSVLRRLTAWFDDPHLFIYESGRVDSVESRRRAEQVARTTLSEADARAYFARHAGHLDPIEGIWYDGALRLAIVPDSVRAGRFMAIVLEPDTTSWRSGAVRATFTRRGNGRYDGVVLTRNYAVRHQDVAIYKRVLMQLAPGLWGKAFPILPADSGLLDPADAHRPTLLVRGHTVVVSIPSHDPALKRSFDSLLAAHADDLLHAAHLIVDLRGNEGGASFMTDGLMPYIASSPQAPDPLEFRRSLMLSSPDQIHYAGLAFGPDTTPLVRSLVQRLQANPGRLVPLFAGTDTVPDPVTDSVISGPERVGILTDRGTVSAGEVIVLEALRSRRARVFGQPTAGALDYQNVNIVAFAAGERRWYLGYPTVTRSAELPRGGMRGKGIQPSVVVDFSRMADPIGWVDQALARN